MLLVLSNMEDKLKNSFATITDPRIERHKKHSLTDIISLTIIASICGIESWESIEDFGKSRIELLKTILELENGIPSHDTIERLFKRIESKEFEKSFMNWTDHIRVKTQGQIINFDGKTIRGSKDKSNNKYALQMVSAWCGENNLVLGQIKTQAKINEIAALKELITLMDIEDCLITIDAMGCQKEIVKMIVDKNADYVIAVKENQGNLLKEIKDSFRFLKPNDTHEELTKDHGRIEARKCEIITNLEMIETKQQWEKLTTLIKVSSSRTIGTEQTKEERYYISCQNKEALHFQNAIRKHWSIENSLHWVLDVQFNEDHIRKRKDNAGENMVIVRRIALNKLKQHSFKRFGVNNKRLKAAYDDKFLLQVLKN